jgi:hypothetical protein
VLELAVALLIALLALSTLLGTLSTLLAAPTAPALLTFPVASLLSIALTARRLLTTLLTAALIFHTIVCHDSSSHVRHVNYLNCSQV